MRQYQKILTLLFVICSIFGASVAQAGTSTTVRLGYVPDNLLTKYTVGSEHARAAASPTYSYGAKVVAGNLHLYVKTRLASFHDSCEKTHAIVANHSGFSRVYFGTKETQRTGLFECTNRIFFSADALQYFARNFQYTLHMYGPNGRTNSDLAIMLRDAGHFRHYSYAGTSEMLVERDEADDTILVKMKSRVSQCSASITRNNGASLDWTFGEFEQIQIGGPTNTWCGIKVAKNLPQVYNSYPIRITFDNDGSGSSYKSTVRMY